jgi:hypothetical protein
VTEAEEIVAYDGHGAPLFAWQIGARIDDDTRRRLLERIDNNQT